MEYNEFPGEGGGGEGERRRRVEDITSERQIKRAFIHYYRETLLSLSLPLSSLSLSLPLSRHRISSNLFLKIAFPRVPRCHVGISPSCLSAYKSHFTRTYVHRIHFRRACAWTRTRKRSEITRTASPQAPSPASQAFPFQVSLLLALLFDSFFQHVRSLI